MTTSSAATSIIERQGIETVAENARTGKPSDLFWPWFAANVSVFGMSYGTWLLGFGISFWQATLVGIAGVIISFLLCGLVAIAGKRGSVPTMVLTRAAFGVHGQKLPGLISWIVSIGWETILTILAVLATATVFQALGFASGDGLKIVAVAFIAALIVTASVLGYHTIMRLQSVLTYATGIMTLLFLILTLPKVNFAQVMSIENGSLGATIGAFAMAMTGFGLGWINIAADWSRYQKRATPDRKIVFWNTLGGATAPVLLVVAGLLLAGSDETLRDQIAADPVGALTLLLPGWALIPFWLTAVLSLISGAVLGIYSSGLTLQSLGFRVPRPLAAAIDGVILTIGTIYVVFFHPDFRSPFETFLLTLGVPLAAWAGIMIADTLRRKADYDETALFDANGRYGACDWISIGTFLVAVAAGWGMVVNASWQGYLMEPLGLGSYNTAAGSWEGDFAYANIGIIFALVFSFVVTYFARAGKIRRQETQ